MTSAEATPAAGCPQTDCDCPRAAHGEVDIDAIREDLLGTVHRTLEPVRMSVWLIGAERDFPGSQAPPQ